MSKIWLDEKDLSRWMFLHCYNIEDRPETRKLITDSEWAYMYCRNIKNRPEISQYIIEPKFIKYYNIYFNIS